MSTKIKTSDGWKDVAGENVSAYFVRKPAWSQAVAITNTQLQAGYTVPSDGIFILVGNAEALDTTVFCKVNNVIVGMSRRNMNYNDFIQCSVPVLENDIIQTTDAIELQSALFIPFEDSAVAEPEVVTPELIRNLHDPDWSQAVAITSEQLLAGYAAPKRGIFVGSVLPKNVNEYLQLLLNNIVIAFGSLGTSNGDIRNAVASVPVSQGDVIKSTAATLYDGNYKIHFVPYKAQ